MIKRKKTSLSFFLKSRFSRFFNVTQFSGPPRALPVLRSLQAVPKEMMQKERERKISSPAPPLFPLTCSPPSLRRHLRGRRRRPRTCAQTWRASRLPTRRRRRPRSSEGARSGPGGELLLCFSSFEEERRSALREKRGSRKEEREKNGRRRRELVSPIEKRRPALSLNSTHPRQHHGLGCRGHGLDRDGRAVAKHERGCSNQGMDAWTRHFFQIKKCEASLTVFARRKNKALL